MTNDVATTRTDPSQLPTTKTDADAIGQAAQSFAGFDKMLKFKKGRYYDSDGEEIDKGTEFIAHVIGWTLCWIKFKDGELRERRVYPVIKRLKVPERDELDDNDESQWEIGPNGTPADPWVFQHLLPLENKNNGDFLVFVTPSFGGKRAVGDLCSAYFRRFQKVGQSHMPIIKLQEAMMPSKKWGEVPRPYFEIVGWEGMKESVREANVPEQAKRADFDDQIPF